MYRNRFKPKLRIGWQNFDAVCSGNCQQPQKNFRTAEIQSRNRIRLWLPTPDFVAQFWMEKEIKSLSKNANLDKKNKFANVMTCLSCIRLEFVRRMPFYTWLPIKNTCILNLMTLSKASTYTCCNMLHASFFFCDFKFKFVVFSGASCENIIQKQISFTLTWP